MGQNLLTKEKLETALKKGEKPLVLDFYADWCMPCRMQAPQFQQAEAAMQTQADFYKIDIDAQPELAAEFGVMSIPTLVILHAGNVCWRNVGVTGKDEIIAELRKALA